MPASRQITWTTLVRLFPLYRPTQSYFLSYANFFIFFQVFQCIYYDYSDFWKFIFCDAVKMRLDIWLSPYCKQSTECVIKRILKLVNTWGRYRQWQSGKLFWDAVYRTTINYSHYDVFVLGSNTVLEDGKSTWSVPEIFVIKLYSCPNSSAQEPLHSAWCNFARAVTSTTSRNVLNFKVISQRSRYLGVFLCAWCCMLPADSTFSLEQARHNNCSFVDFLTGFMLWISFNLICKNTVLQAANKAMSKMQLRVHEGFESPSNRIEIVSNRIESYLLSAESPATLM